MEILPLVRLRRQTRKHEDCNPMRQDAPTDKIDRPSVSWIVRPGCGGVDLAGYATTTPGLGRDPGQPEAGS